MLLKKSPLSKSRKRGVLQAEKNDENRREKDPNRQFLLETFLYVAIFLLFHGMSIGANGGGSGFIGLKGGL
ncbi:MAG: hypothetical protein N2513_07865 [Deltaproteobacteria bacterium]|nr:hypothetical protein [Deltaproteobacteria bacterium]